MNPIGSPIRHASFTDFDAPALGGVAVVDGSGLTVQQGHEPILTLKSTDATRKSESSLRAITNRLDERYKLADLLSPPLQDLSRLLGACVKAPKVKG
jgi:hypothetical protein